MPSQKSCRPLYALSYGYRKTTACAPFPHLVIIVIIIDRNTNWIETQPIHSITVDDVCHASLTSWFSLSGEPLCNTTVCGTHFESKLFAQFFQILRLRTLRILSYYPQRKIIRFHRIFKATLLSSKND